MGVKTTSGTTNCLRRTAMPSSTGYSACGWAYVTSVGNGSGGNWGNLFGSGDGVSTWQQFGYSGGNLCLTTTAGNSGNPLAFASSPALNAWFFWYLVADPTNFSGGWISHGGSSFVTQSLANSSFTVADFGFLGNNDGEFMYGTADGLKIWSAVMTAAQMEMERFSRVPKCFASPYLWTPLPSSADVKDHFSGTGHDLTINGSVADGELAPVYLGAGGRAKRKISAGTPPPPPTGGLWLAAAA